jgi:cytochrome c oxidase subunit 3
MIAKKSVLGMWIFLVTEMLFFGGLFLCLAIGFFLHPSEFRAGVRHMDLVLGTLNTAVLLTSSWVLAVGLRDGMHANSKRAVRLFILTAALGVLFLFVKFSEYAHHAHDHLVPGLDWQPAPALPLATQLFFFLYFVMTLIHSVHLIIGIVLVAGHTWRYSKKGATAHLEAALENVGLFWHFVDVIWIFLFPCLYLIGRT